jgi:YHS domain-containing protein
MRTEFRKQGKARKTAKDPVCGSDVDVEKSPKDVILEYEVYFCSEECRKKFRAGPSGRKAR